ncbi:dyf-7 [Pristionchus pacificus]|uniref:Dyf-7 n=1 Tax=Pristionchus pacificus TaxID=54126 RepID=A0A2A6BFM8_PRIPA|nr:dyf-7 [Pristionchus pacificus]|eukprot:PDM64690.1 dyf-7 [Pristionchus pacificus]
MLRSLLLALPILLRIPFIDAAGFVEEVACSAESVTVMLNRTNPDLVALMNDPKAMPVAYVYGHKMRAQCGTVLRNEKGAVNYNLTIAYGKACDVKLTNLEPNHRISEMAIVLENNVAVTKPSFKQILNQVSCVYNSNVQTFKFSEMNPSPKIEQFSGGNPKPKVDMVFRSIDGTPLREARVGEQLEFYLALQPDNAYKAILPKECMFSDREDMQSPDTHRITFVQGSCPVQTVAEIIDPVAHVNQEVFFSKFKTFRFRDQSTVFVHCTAQVCLTKEECATSCFKNITNSDLNAARLRFRHKRSARSESGKAEFEHIHGKLQVYTESEQREIVDRASPLLGVSSSSLYFFSAALLAVSIASIIVIAYLARKLYKRNKESTFDLYSAAQLRSMANSSATLVDRYPGYPLHVQTAFQ